MGKHRKDFTSVFEETLAMKILRQMLKVGLPLFGLFTSVLIVSARAAEFPELGVVPRNGGFRMEGYWVWCGSVIKGDDGNVDGSQLHMLSYLGQTWGKGAPRFTNEQVIKWTRDVVGQGGAVTWDAPVQTNGLISQPFVARSHIVWSKEFLFK